jgi:polar amino acid transport system substrate-binding protein
MLFNHLISNASHMFCRDVLISNKTSKKLMNRVNIIYVMLFMQSLLFSSAAISKHVVLAAAAHSIPTSYVENNNQTGILVDIVNEAFSRIDHTVEIKLMPWARCLKWVEQGYVDGIFSAYITDSRKAFLNYVPEVLITQRQAFFVSIDSTIRFDGELNSLTDKTIGVINETSYGSRLDSALQTDLFKYQDKAQSSKSNVLKLLAGRVDIIPSYTHVALYTAKKLGKIDQIKELAPPLEETPSYLAFTNKRDYSTVIEDFNIALIAMKKDGTYDSIFQKYLE